MPAHDPAARDVSLEALRAAVARAERASPQAPPPPEPQDADADPHAVARAVVLRQLTGSPKSRSQLEQALRRKGCPDDVAATVLDRFEEVGLVDDEAFARSWVSARQSGKGLARRALAQELRRKGVDDETAQVALEEVDHEDEEQAARALVQRKLRSLQRVDDVVATRRLVGMLGRKGYPAGLAFAVVREELAAAGREDLPESPG